MQDRRTQKFKVFTYVLAITIIYKEDRNVNRFHLSQTERPARVGKAKLLDNSYQKIHNVFSMNTQSWPNPVNGLSLLHVSRIHPIFLKELTVWI